MYKITTKSHWGEIVKTWTASEADQVMYASRECDRAGYFLQGYDEHRGDYDNEYYPKFNDDGDQISGATVATFEDAVAWFGHDVQSITVEEIGGN
jgi:hypothetical protein